MVFNSWEALHCIRLIMPFDPQLAVRLSTGPLAFVYGQDVFGPLPELRRLDAIRYSLLFPSCNGPDPVYCIAMDVGRKEHAEALLQRMLLFAVVAYEKGRLGDEPVRSQGHVHAIAPHCGWSTPELIEIWQGNAILYMQETAGEQPGRCVAIEAGPGDKVVIPPGWAHSIINRNPEARMMFGAWCDRQYAFDYEGVRAHRGLAWLPLLREVGIEWQRNASYAPSRLASRPARAYPELGISDTLPIYEQFARDQSCVQWVSEPALVKDLWEAFEP
jgi:glucose-6-phosphate isomerase